MLLRSVDVPLDDDLVQLGGARALGSAGSFVSTMWSDAWTFRIIRNLWIDETRRARGSRRCVPRPTGSAVASLRLSVVNGTDFRLRRRADAKAVGARGREFGCDGGSESCNLAVTCLADGGWTTSFAMVADADGMGDVPASSSDTVEACLSSVCAGEALPINDKETFPAGIRP